MAIWELPGAPPADEAEWNAAWVQMGSSPYVFYAPGEASSIKLLLPGYFSPKADASPGSRVGYQYLLIAGLAGARVDASAHPSLLRMGLYDQLPAPSALDALIEHYVKMGLVVKDYVSCSALVEAIVTLVQSAKERSMDLELDDSCFDICTTEVDPDQPEDLDWIESVTLKNVVPDSGSLFIYGFLMYMTWPCTTFDARKNYRWSYAFVWELLWDISRD